MRQCRRSRLAAKAIVLAALVLAPCLDISAQEQKSAADTQVAGQQQKFKLLSVRRIGYTRPGSPTDPLTKEGNIRPLAWDNSFNGKLIGASIYFAVLERVGTDDGDPWGVGLEGFAESFKEGKSTTGVYSPKLDTRAKYLYLYQLVNDRGLDPPLGQVKFAFETSFGNILPVAAVKLDLRVDPRHITSWGHFHQHGFVATVVDREQSGRPRPDTEGKPLMSLAVSANSSILGELPRKRYSPRCQAFALGKMEESFGVHTSTHNLKNSYKLEILSRKTETKLAAWEKNVLQASVNARQPDFVQIDQADVDDRAVPVGRDLDPVAAWFRVLWHKSAERDNLVYLGHHSPVFGFTSNLEPREENVLIEDLSAAQRRVEVQAVAHVHASAAAAQADGVAVGLGVGTVVAPAPAASFAGVGSEALWLGSSGTGGGGGLLLPPAGSAGAIGTPPASRGSGGGLGGGSGGGRSSGELSHRPDFSVTLINQQTQSQQRNQNQTMSGGGCCCHATDPQVVPEPGTFLLALLGLPLFYWLIRRSRPAPGLAA